MSIIPLSCSTAPVLRPSSAPVGKVDDISTAAKDRTSKAASQVLGTPIFEEDNVRLVPTPQNATPAAKLRQQLAVRSDRPLTSRRGSM